MGKRELEVCIVSNVFFFFFNMCADGAETYRWIIAHNKNDSRFIDEEMCDGHIQYCINFLRSFLAQKKNPNSKWNYFNFRWEKSMSKMMGRRPLFL